MYLSKLKIFGFKSFAQKVEVTFPGDGITSVVGPNGCGKSNIVDAIRWVMGEQRVKQLRGDKMADVIFSGTEDRPAMNFAEVSLLINNDKGLLPSEYSEIQITRRAHRNGDSEYLINNQECRLKDIHNLFYDTGMGAASYSLMEQKMIDSLLSDKTEERRQLFEEAAGINKYKQQRKETGRHLDKVSVDLERVEESLAYTRRSVKSHERQARKAAQWHELQQELKALEVSVAADRYAGISVDFSGHKSKYEAEAAEQLKLQTLEKTLETKREEKRLAMTTDEDSYRELEQIVASRKTEITTRETELKHLDERLEQLETNVQRSGEEVASSLSKVENMVREREESRNDLVRRQESLETGSESLRNFDESSEGLQVEYDTVRNESMNLSTRRVETSDRYSKLSSEQARNIQQREDLETRISELSGEKEDLTLEQEAAEEDGFTRQKELDESSDALTNLTYREEERKKQMSALSAELSILVAREREKENSRASLQSRSELLARMAAANEGMGSGTKHLLERAPHRISGILADKIRPQSGYLAQVEFCMGEGMQALLISGNEDPRDLLNLLDAEKAGRVLFGVSHSSSENAVVPTIVGEGCLGPVADFVDADEDVTALVRSILRPYCLVESDDAAMELARGNRAADLWFVAPGGRAWHSSGLVRGGSGKGDSSGILARREEKLELDKELELCLRDLDELGKQRSDLEERNRELSQQGEKNQVELVDLRKRESEAVAMLQSCKFKMQSAKDRLENIELRLEELRHKLEPVLAWFGEQHEDPSVLKKEREELEVKYTCAVEKLHEVEERKAARNKERNELRESLQDDKRHVDRLVQKLEYLDIQEKETRKFADKREVEQREYRGQAEELRIRAEEIRGQVEAELELLIGEEERRDVAREIYDSRMGELDDLQGEIRITQKEERKKADSMHELEMRMESLRTNKDRLVERIFQEFEVHLDRPGDFETVEYDPDRVDEKLRALKSSMKKLGNINPGVFEEYEEQKARLEEVQKQFDDLDKARVSLQKTIRKLDKVARERFLETFHEVRKNFHEVFTSLMSGGDTRLELEEGVDPLESRIEINARPTGKKMRGVSLLSGGERALTATALLFALYLVRPSPYCILDEVDGPLDDANIGRFVSLLRRFSRETQFIVVTHNKRTMAASDRLYGVTQEIKGVSQISSVQLDEAVGMVN